MIRQISVLKRSLQLLWEEWVGEVAGGRPFRLSKLEIWGAYIRLVAVEMDGDGQTEISATVSMGHGVEELWA